MRRGGSESDSKLATYTCIICGFCTPENLHFSDMGTSGSEQETQDQVRTNRKAGVRNQQTSSTYMLSAVATKQTPDSRGKPTEWKDKHGDQKGGGTWWCEHSHMVALWCI